MNKLRTIHLEGKLKDICDGQSAVQMVGDNLTIIINGLASMFGDAVKEHIRQNNWHITRGDSDTTGIHENQIHDRLEDGVDLYILPQIEGAGKVFNIIVGIALIVIGVWSLMVGNPTGLQMAQAGMTIMSGAMMIYTALATPNSAKTRSVEEAPSFIFNGAQNVLEQGGAVPVVYGRFRTGSVVVSAGIDSEQLTAYTSPTSENPAGDSQFDRLISVVV